VAQILENSRHFLSVECGVHLGHLDGNENQKIRQTKERKKGLESPKGF
jgi:hypothetical protein